MLALVAGTTGKDLDLRRLEAGKEERMEAAHTSKGKLRDICRLQIGGCKVCRIFHFCEGTWPVDGEVFVSKEWAICNG